MGTPTFDTYDAELAQVVLQADGDDHGLMGFLGMRIVEVGPGFAAAEFKVQPELVHQFGALHGGVVAALVDHVLGSAVLPVVPRGTWPATLEFKLNYMAAVRSGVVRANAQVLALRKRTAVVQVEVVNEDRTVAAALGTVSLNPPKG